MELASKMNHHRSLVTKRSMLWVLIEILHSSLAVMIPLVDWRQRFLITNPKNGLKQKIIPSQKKVSKQINLLNDCKWAYLYLIKGFRSYFKGVLRAASASCGGFYHTQTAFATKWGHHKHFLEIGPESRYLFCRDLSLVQIILLSGRIKWKNEYARYSF